MGFPARIASRTAWDIARARAKSPPRRSSGSSPRPWLHFSVAAFYARLDDLRGGRLAPGGGALISNEAEGTTSGIEAHPKAGSSDLGAPAALCNDPRHSLKIRSTYRLTDDIDLDIGWRYVSALSYLSTVPGYQEADARIAWRLDDRIELAISGVNLLHRGHVEFDEHGLPAVIPRAAYFQVCARF